MERVAALVEKLAAQLAQKADKSQLKHTVIQLLTELAEDAPIYSNMPNNVSVLMPLQEETYLANVKAATVEPLQQQPIKEAIIESQALNKVPDTDFPKLQAKPLNETLYEQAPVEVITQLSLAPIKDLKAAIGINEKFQFIQALFGGDEKVFEASIKTINAFKIYAEAQFWIKQELRLKYQWSENSEETKAFDQLVQRRFL